MGAAPIARRNGRALLAAGVMMMLGVGCGYRTLGPRAGTAAVRICMMPFSEAGPTDMSGDLAEALGAELAAEGFTLVPHPNQADRILTGQIELRNVPGTTLKTVQLYTVDVTVTAELWGEGHEPLWQEAVSLQEDFLPTDPALDVEPLVTERRRRVAILRLTERAAEQLVQSMRLAGASGKNL